MRRVKLVLAALLGGALLGGLCTYRLPGRPAKAGLLGATQDLCHAIVANDDAEWASVRRRYSSPAGTDPGTASDAAAVLKAARAQSVHFHREDPVGEPRETAFGLAGERILAAFECPVGAGSRARVVTVRWLRGPDRRWRPDDVTSEPATGSHGVKPTSEARRDAE